MLGIVSTFRIYVKYNKNSGNHAKTARLKRATGATLCLTNHHLQFSFGKVRVLRNRLLRLLKFHRPGRKRAPCVDARCRLFLFSLLYPNLIVFRIFVIYQADTCKMFEMDDDFDLDEVIHSLFTSNKLVLRLKSHVHRR